MDKKYKKLMKIFKELNKLGCLKFSLVCVNINGEDKWFYKDNMTEYTEASVKIEITPIIDEKKLKWWKEK